LDRVLQRRAPCPPPLLLVPHILRASSATDDRKSGLLSGRRCPGRVASPGPLLSSSAGNQGSTIRVPSYKDPARRMQKTLSFGTTTREVLALADWLRCWQGARGDDGGNRRLLEGAVCRLEAEGFECVLADAKHVKNLPGRPKRDMDRLIARERNRLMDGPDLVTAMPPLVELTAEARPSHRSLFRPSAPSHRSQVAPST